MKNILKTTTITGKIISVTLMLLVVMSLSIALPYGILSYRAELKKLESLEQTLNEDYDSNIKHQVETTYSLIKGVYSKYKDGSLTEGEAELLAADLVRDLSYGDGGYFWIDTKDGTNVVLFGSDAEGKNRYNLKDAKGNLIIQNIINAALNGGGFSEYWFPKKGSDIPLPKRSYSLYFEPFDWVIGTGNYIDDIEARISVERQIEMARLRDLIFLMIVVTLGVLILAAVAIVMFGRSFSNPIVKLAEKTSKMSEGDLAITFSKNRKDEIGVLQESLIITIDKLRQVISEVVIESNNVATASSEMRKTADQMSHRASEQSASTEEISTSVEEMTANIQSNTDNANAAEKISVQTQERMSVLQEAMKQNLGSMKEVKEKTSIINDIATQTNILALNAAVEAARAGEYGRGFAVVAAEVRKLSDYTQKAASEIDSLTTVSLGAAEESWENLEQLLPDIQSTVERIREIYASSKEQSIGVGHINNAVQSLVGVSSQNAAASEELEFSSEELARQSVQLKEIIGFFKLQ